MSLGLEQLNECLALLLAPLQREIAELREKVCEVAAAAAAEESGLVSARELAGRWNVAGGTPEQVLANLAERCRLRGLTRLRGGKGWEATYSRADVERAEDFAAGKVRSRKPVTALRRARA